MIRSRNHCGAISLNFTAKIRYKHIDFDKPIVNSIDRSLVHRRSIRQCLKVTRAYNSNLIFFCDYENLNVHRSDKSFYISPPRNIHFVHKKNISRCIFEWIFYKYSYKFFNDRTAIIFYSKLNEFSTHSDRKISLRFLN